MVSRIFKDPVEETPVGHREALAVQVEQVPSDRTSSGKMPGERKVPNDVRNLEPRMRGCHY
jgi:hypothetical protein